MKYKIPKYKSPFKHRSATALLQVKQGYWLYKPLSRRTYKICHQDYFPTICSTQQNEEIITDELRTRTTSHVSSTKNSLFCSRVAGFASNPSCLKYWLLRPFFYKEAICKGSTGKGLPYTAKAVPAKDYFTHLTLIIARKGRWVINPNYHASHPRRFCAVVNVVAQRYDILCDWLWDACHMAGVRWGSRCKAFVARKACTIAFSKAQGSCHKTSNNQP
jgi:hypothetical protein